tara:strand:- start:48 stop:383 length:336 start_codon:yes stop_codon:yes gene_type:complete
MAITHTETVSDLTVLNDGTDVVSEVEIKTVSVDDSDPSTLTQTSYDNYTVDSSGGTSAAGFVAFGSLSETVIKGWVADELAASNTKINAEAWINSVKTPPTPTQVSKALPF